MEMFEKIIMNSTMALCWISTKEQLPQEKMHVLFVVNHEGDIVWRQIHMGYYLEGAFRPDETVDYKYVDEVTHWMSCPKIPE